MLNHLGLVDDSVVLDDYGKPLIVCKRVQNNCEKCGKFVHKESKSELCTVCLFGPDFKESFIQK